MRYGLSIVLAAGLLAFPGAAQAQMGMGGGMSMGGGSRTGASSYGSSSSGMFGSRSLGGTLQAGQRTFAAGNMLNQAVSGAGQLTGSERFVRGNRQAGNFVGADASDVQAIMQNIPGYTQGRMTNTNIQSMRTRGSRQSGPGLQVSSNQQQVSLGTKAGTNMPLVRTRLNVEFEHPALVGPVSNTVLTERLNRSTRIKSLSPLEVQIEGRTAILRGEVATVHDRTLAETVARLEPGIAEVRNELRVPGLPALSAPALLPTPGQAEAPSADSPRAPVPDAK